MKSGNILGGLFLWGLCSAVFAADIPQDVLGSQQFDEMQCESQNTQDCINSVCLNSSQRDCQAQCQKMAAQKCQQQANE